MRKLKALLTILSLLGIIIGCTEATTTEVITNDKKPEYKISFNANGGKGTMSDINIIAETSIILPENTFTRDNYTFMGWSTTGDGEVMFKNGAIFEGLYSDITLYAKWEKEVVPVVKITITFDVNGAGGTAPTAIEVTPDENVELPALTNAKFSHWNTKADGSGQSYKTTATFTESVTLYAILLAENAHTITYELDGGVNNTVNPFSFTEEDTVTLKNPTKDGYKFVGWYETADFSGSVVKGWFAGDKTANVILYAKWEKEATSVVKITISFDVNGAGGTTPTAIETTPDESVYLPVLTNAKFLHWNTKADGSGQSYNIIATFAESVTLYAILLAENAYKITYVLDGGVNNSANPFSFTEDEDIVLKEPTKDGYYFLGWYEDNNNMYIDSLKAWNAGEKSSNVTLYAKWVKSYKITYVLNGGVNSSYNPSFFTENDDRVYLEKPTKDGYFFCGWYETADFTGSKIIDRVAVKKTDVIFYAKWIKEEELIPGTYTAGTGVYELRAPKSKIFNAWGGFCVLLLKEEQLAAVVNPQEDGTFDMPTAQLGGGNLLFPKYASAEGNAEITYYDEKVLNSAWATLDKDFFTFYVDMSKILIDDTAVEVKVFANNNELMGDDWLGFGDNLDLTDYKPYVVALFDGTSDIVDGETTYAKYLGQCSWGAGIWEMTTSTATKPTSFDKFLDKEPQCINIRNYPKRTLYNVGDVLDLTELTVEATYSDGSTSYVDVSFDMVSGFDSSVAGTQTLTVTYGDCTATFDVEVVENSVSSLNITSTPYKTSYYVGEELDLSGLEIEAVYSNGSISYVDVSLDMISGFDSSVAGTQTLTVTYGDCTATFDVEVEKQIVYHTITFNANGGNGTMAPRTVEETSSYYFNIESDFTAPTGYGFSHWNTKADGSGTTYEWGDYYPILEDITLYAQWKKVESSLDVNLPESTRFSISQTVNGDKVTFECSSYSYYNSYAWFIDGVKQTSTSSEMTVDTSTMDAGSYTVMLTVKYDGKYWSENATLTIKK